MAFEAHLAELVRFVELRFTALEKKLTGLEQKVEANATKSHSKDRRSHSVVSHYGGSLGHEFANSITAVVGLKEALTSEHRPARLVWTFLFCLGVGATLFYLYRTTDEYLTSPTATSIRVSDESRHKFLPMLICPQSWFDTEKATKLGLSVDALKYSLSYLDSFFTLDSAASMRAKHEFLSVYDSHNFESLLDYYSYISPDIEPFQSNVTFPSAYTCRGCVNNTKPQKIILDWNLCYIFHLQPVEKFFGTYSAVRNLKIKFTDRTEGLVPFTPHWFLYFKHLDNTFLSTHPKVSVRAFHYNTVKFDMHEFIVLNKQNAPCKELEDPRSYSASTCMAECHNEMYKNYVNCGLIWLSVPSSKPAPADLCNYMDKLAPKNWTLPEFFASEENARIDAKAAEYCVTQCPRKCQRLIYSTTLQIQESFTDLDTKRLGGTDNKNVSFIDIALKHGAVYQGGITVLTEMHTYSFTQLVNNVGGTLGLFVGATIMTFAQLIVFVVDYVTSRTRIDGGIGHGESKMDEAKRRY